MTRRGLAILLPLVLAACGTSASPSASATSTPVETAGATATPTAEASAGPSATTVSSPLPAGSEPPSKPPASPTPAARQIDLPDTPVTATLDQSYNTTGDEFDPADLGGLEPGDVSARWYVDGDRWAVHFDGLDIEATGPLCPGSSAQTAAGFEHVSNAPTEAGACEGFDGTLAEDPVGVRLCGDEVLYLTAIPADVHGMLFASIETQYQAAGSVVGLTSMAHPTHGEAPEIDLEALGCEAVPPTP